MGPSLKHPTFINFIKKLDETNAYQFNALMRFSVWIILSIVMVKLDMDLPFIGNFEYSLFLVFAFSFITNTGIQNYFLVKTGKSLTPNWRKFMLLQFIAGLIAVLIFYLLIGFSYRNLSLGLLIMTIGLGSSPELFFLINKKKNLLFLYSFISYSLLLCGLIMCMFYNESLLFPIYASWNIGRVLLGLILIPIPKISNGITFDKSLILYFTMAFLGQGMMLIDGLLIKACFPLDVFSVFKYGARELPFITILIGGFVTVQIVKFNSKPSETLAYVKRNINRLMHLFFPLSIILMFLSPILYEQIYDSRYLKSSIIFNIYLLILISRIVVPQVFLFAKEDIKALNMFGLIEIIFNLILSLILLRYYDIIGVAYATLISYLFHKLMLVVYLKTKHGIRLGTYINTKTWGIYSFLLLAFHIINALIYA